jgi:hypothetical protein
LPLRVVEVADQLDVALNVIDPAAPGFTVGAVFRVNHGHHALGRHSVVASRVCRHAALLGDLKRRKFSSALLGESYRTQVTIAIANRDIQTDSRTTALWPVGLFWGS